MISGVDGKPGRRVPEVEAYLHDLVQIVPTLYTPST
jgi:hypothetical protein